MTFRIATLAMALCATACTTPAANDAGADIASDVLDASADGGAPGTVCSFNRDCRADSRCACTDGNCACEIGVRGTGRAGMDACTSGNDCESALCLEGDGNALVCSAPCDSASDCPSTLPRCVDVPFVGRICARDPAASDGGTDAGVDVPGCTGACASNTLSASIAGHTGGFDRAQHGTSGTDGIYVEAHFGGDPACPTMSSPTPARTLVINGLRSVAVGTVLTQSDGVTASLLDFDGSLTTMPIDRASAVRATARYVDRGAYVSFDLEATFPDGTITGGFFAPHCASLDEP